MAIILARTRINLFVNQPLRNYIHSKLNKDDNSKCKIQFTNEFRVFGNKN